MYINYRRYDFPYGLSDADVCIIAWHMFKICIGPCLTEDCGPPEMSKYSRYDHVQ